jgi:D-glycero-D-manno-heptose 1,7-bisphosphate phosphatase
MRVPILVVTNQSAIGRGILSAGELESIHEQVCAEAALVGGRIDQFFVCPHAPAERCACRKPKPGLLFQAAARYDLDLARCILVGDSMSDMQAAEAAGCRSIVLVRTGRQGATLDSELAALGARAATTLVMDNLGAAARQIAVAGQLFLETSCE